MSSDGVLKIWGRKNSINVMKVLWACEELGLPFDRVDVGGAFGGTQEPEYLARNPNARVPTIEDKGFTLWESNVIVRYLAHTYGHPGLMPADDAARWVAEQWMDWQQTTLHPEITPLFWQLIRTEPAKQDPEKIEAARQGCIRAFAMLDERLTHNDFVAGKAFSMGDIPVGCAVYRWLNFQIERPPMKALEAWYQRLTDRPGYQTHIMNPMT
ncbi:MAG TPA: glutathione S-transferase family protein [bacterium]|nr:glutathione S-transferase family protein [bacterium]